MQSISPPHLNNCPRCPVIGTQDCPDEENYHLLTLRFSLRIPFCSHAVQRMLDGVWDSRLDEYVKYSLNIKDELGEDEKLGIRGRLTAMVDTQMSGYLKIGPALDRLEEDHPGLGTAFYRLFQSSLARWIRVFGLDSPTR